MSKRVFLIQIIVGVLALPLLNPVLCAGDDEHLEWIYPSSYVWYAENKDGVLKLICLYKGDKQKIIADFDKNYKNNKRLLSAAKGRGVLYYFISPATQRNKDNESSFVKALIEENESVTGSSMEGGGLTGVFYIKKRKIILGKKEWDLEKMKKNNSTKAPRKPHAKK